MTIALVDADGNPVAPTEGSSCRFIVPAFTDKTTGEAVAPEDIKEIRWQLQRRDTGGIVNGRKFADCSITPADSVSQILSGADLPYYGKATVLTLTVRTLHDTVGGDVDVVTVIPKEFEVIGALAVPDTPAT